jgi:PAS domain S-box-containing protein
MTTTHESKAAPAVSSDAAELQALRDFFDNAAIGMHWVDADGIIIRANLAELTLLGYDEDEYIGHRIAEFHVDQSVLDDILSRLAAGETLHNYEAQMRAKDGSVKSVLIDSSVRFQDGEFLHTRCLTREITQQKRVERSLRESEALFQSLAIALPALIVTTGIDGEIEDISESYRDYTGLTVDEARDWANHQVIHPDDMDQSMRVWSAAIESGEAMQNEMRLRRHDGVYRWYLVQGMPVRDAEGAILRWITVSVDIEDRKLLEARERFLAETTARMVTPVDSSELLAELSRLTIPALADICAIGLWDDSPETVRIETSGADERELPFVGKIHLRRWWSEPGSDERIDAVIAAGRAVFVPNFSPEWVLACAPDQQQRDAAIAVGACSLVCVPLIARDRTIGMTTLAMTRSKRRYDRQDLLLVQEVMSRASVAVDNARLFRELRETAEDLRRANASKDEFLGLVSHELKTPITMIYGNAEVLRLRSEHISEEDRRQALEDISKESERLHRIIDNLLILARLERGQPIEREPLLARRIVSKVIAEHRAHFPGRQIRTVMPPEPVPVDGAPLYIEQVLRNLISNAEKYSPADEPIDVQVERIEGNLSISVLDRGPGFPSDEADRLFTPFYRSPLTSASAAGIGIGLAVCKRLIEAQGGEIWARRRTSGGSEFGFMLPAVMDVE